ncbi:MAG: response regulator transcription factor [Actinomycetota bacterium]|nr:response regulator transcription factor [Actinomycetota bacterium]
MTAPGSGDEPIRVVLTDDQVMIRAGFRMLLDAQPDIEVVGEAGTGTEVAELLATLAADVVLMDVQMPDMDGIRATELLVGQGAVARILIVTTFERDDYVFDALRAGASGFLLKTAPPEELVDAVRVVASGRSLLDPTVTSRVIAEFAAAGPGVPRSERLNVLTDREREVLVQVARGLSNAEIGEVLYVGEATVKTHVSNVLSKLALRDRVQAVVFAYEHGLVRPGAA